VTEKKRFWILKCPRCKTYQIADSRNKTKSCSQCALRFEIADLPILSYAEDARGARVVVAELKMPKGSSSPPKDDIAVSGPARSESAE